MTENLSKTAFLPVQIGPWSMPAGCEELGWELEPKRKVIMMNNVVLERR